MTRSKPVTVGRILQGSRFEAQIEAETNAIHNGVERYRKLAREAVERGDGASLKPAERLLVYWHTPLVQAIKQEQRAIRAGDPGLGRGIYGPVLYALDSERLALLTLHEMISKTMTAPVEGVLLIHLAYSVGSAVVAEIHADMLRRDHQASWKELDRRFKTMTTGRVNAWAKKTLTDSMWSRRVCTHLGTVLTSLASKCCSIGYDEWKPAFKHDKRWRDNQKKGVVILDDEAFTLIEEGHAFRQFLRPRYSPMLVPPCPWDTETEGGYVKVRTPFISKPTTEQQAALKEADLSQVHEALNALNSVPWEVNSEMLSCARQLWDDGGGIGKLPKADLEELPPKPDGIESDEVLLKSWKKEAHGVHSRNAKQKGARIEFMNKLDVGEAMLEQAPIYFPHQFCFRSRTYPIPVYLNHHGDDVARGMLQFHDAKEVDARGYWWIKVHAANMYGFDKADFDGRVAFIDDRMEMIEQIADGPMDCTELWADADNPFQFVAACIALMNPEYAARLPVQIDGSCNGIQHLCAAGLDEKGGDHVNLVAHPTPQDAYTAVLDIVADKVHADQAAGNPAADWVEPHLVRKVVKQPTMTTVYNVTKVGAREQVRTQLEKRGMQRNRLYQSSAYLSGKILESVGDVFPAAHRIMRWMEECARLMCKADSGRCITWTTPLGFPVVQPYRNLRKVQIKTVMQRLTIGDRDNNSPISLSKQVQGSIPNIVHSWDGCHLQMTAIECYRRAITMAGVHDAYWCHANDVDELGSVLRATFVEMHSRDLVGDLLMQWQKLYPDCEFPEPPAKGNLDLDQVLQSPYFFS